jgi:phosphate transport system substrate-binding protein
LISKKGQAKLALFWSKGNVTQRDTPLGSTRVYSTTTPVAYEQLIQGDMDMIFALTPSAKQQEKAAEAGLTLKLTPFAREAFVFVTSAENPVDRLSLAQIRAIYSGQITNWKEVGGADAPILAFQRQPGSARPLSENTQKLADWFLSDEGQRFVEKAGYAPIR